MCCVHFLPLLLITSPPLLSTPPEATDQGVGGGGRRELKSVPFISYLSALQKSQLLTDDMVNGVEIRCEEKGSCPAGCHLCHHQAVMGGVSGRGRTSNSRSGEQPSPIPVLLEVSRVVPLYSLVQDNVTKEVRKEPGGTKSICGHAVVLLHVYVGVAEKVAIKENQDERCVVSKYPLEVEVEIRKTPTSRNGVLWVYSNPNPK